MLSSKWTVAKDVATHHPLGNKYPGKHIANVELCTIVILLAEASESTCTFNLGIREGLSPNRIDNVCHPKSLVNYLIKRTPKSFLSHGEWFKCSEQLTF